jgi:hypothetical protein
MPSSWHNKQPAPPVAFLGLSFERFGRSHSDAVASLERLQVLLDKFTFKVIVALEDVMGHLSLV